MVNGSRMPYVRNARHEAQRAGKLLTAATGFRVVVQGMIVPVGARTLTVRQEPADVQIVNQRALRRWLQCWPEWLCDETVAAVYEAARKSSPWKTT